MCWIMMNNHELLHVLMITKYSVC